MVGYYATMNALQRFRNAWVSRPRAVRELAILIIAMVFGIAIMPLIIHAAGSRTLGEYANGGTSALLMDFLRGLADGAKAFWFVALGPYAFVLLLRFAWSVGRRQRAPPVEV
jgi:hypothetical protein